jgi:hypothetical protein
MNVISSPRKNRTTVASPSGGIVASIQEESYSPQKREVSIGYAVQVEGDSTSPTTSYVGSSGSKSEVMESPRASTTQNSDAMEFADAVEIPMEANEEEDEDEDYEYEDDDDAHFTSGFLIDNNPSFSRGASLETPGEDIAPATIRDDEEEVEEVPKQKWRQPCRAAVNMSKRAEQETSGGKRRLAQDLYRIMNQDTEDAGYSLQPSSEDSMDKWTIKLFKFDEDSNLAKDMRVLGLEHVELEMSFVSGSELKCSIFIYLRYTNILSISVSQMIILSSHRLCEL